MTEPTVEETAAARASNIDRNLALACYGMLFLNIFFGGLPAIVAVVIAYVQRDQAEPLVRSHYNFQIRIFWVAFAAFIAGCVLTLAGLGLTVSGMVQAGLAHDWDAWDLFGVDMGPMHWDAVIAVMAMVVLGLFFLACIWMLASSAFGFLRLLARRPIGAG